MPEYLDDPTVLTKDKLKSELLAHNVELPSGNPTKDVYVQLYLKNLTAQNSTVTAVTLDAFSSDEELPPPVISSRSRSSGRKATRKTDKVKPEELLTHGVDVRPTVDPTPKPYEKKLQNLLDSHALQPELVLTEIQVNHNGNAESDLYSDKEDEVTEATETPEPEFVAESEPAPVVERTLRSRGKMPVTNRNHSSQHHMVEKIAASTHDSKEEGSDILKGLFPNDINSPTNITATCRRPIKGAAGRPVKSSDLWNDENFLFSPNTTKTTSSSSFYSESHVVNRVNNLPPSTPSLSTSSPRPLSVAPASAHTKAASHSMSLWMKFFLVAIVATFLFLVYYTMESNSINPFATTETEASSGSVE